MSEIIVIGKGWIAEIENSRDILGLNRVEIALFPLNKKGLEAIKKIVNHEAFSKAITTDGVDFRIDKKIDNPKKNKEDAIKIFICPSSKMLHNPAGPLIGEITDFIISLRDEEIKSARKKKK